MYICNNWNFGIDGGGVVMAGEGENTSTTINCVYTDRLLCSEPEMAIFGDGGLHIIIRIML